MFHVKHWKENEVKGMKKVATLERTLTTVGMFETFKATLEINGMDLEKAEFYVYAQNGNCIIYDVSVNDIEDMLPFFNAMMDNHIEVDFNTDNQCVDIVLQ